MNKPMTNKKGGPLDRLFHLSPHYLQRRLSNIVPYIPPVALSPPGKEQRHIHKRGLPPGKPVFPQCAPVQVIAFLAVQLSEPLLAIERIMQQRCNIEPGTALFLPRRENPLESLRDGRLPKLSGSACSPHP